MNKKVNRKIEASLVTTLMLLVTTASIIIKAESNNPHDLELKWQKTFGEGYNDQGYSVELTDGGYIIAGYTGGGSGN